MWGDQGAVGGGVGGRKMAARQATLHTIATGGAAVAGPLRAARGNAGGAAVADQVGVIVRAGEGSMRTCAAGHATVNQLRTAPVGTATLNLN